MVVLLGLSNCGCQSLLNSDLLKRHVNKDQRAAARAHWNDVRGDVKLQIAQQHFAAGRLKETAATLAQVLSMSPENAKAYNLAARLYLEQGQLAKAAEAIGVAVSLSGHDSEAEYLAGIIDERYGRPANALKHYHAAESRSPNVADYLLASAEVMLDLNQPKQALALIVPRLKDFDGSAALRMLAARICRVLDLKAPAITYCREGQQLQADDPTTTVEAGLILIWAGQNDEANDLLRPLVDHAYDAGSLSVKGKPHSNCPVTAGVVHALSRSYMAIKHWAQARAVLKPLMDMDKADIAAWCLYAQAALESGDLHTAAETLSTYHRRNGPTAETLLLRAHIAYRLGDYSAAQDAARRAIKMDSRLESALWLLGLSAQAVGQIDQAKDAYRHALVRHPDSWVARTLLDDLTRSASIRSMIDVLDSRDIPETQHNEDGMDLSPAGLSARSAKLTGDPDP